MNKCNFNRNATTNNDLVGQYTGFIRGNMFNNIYNQYKNYEPANLNPTSEKEQYLLDLDQVAFAMHDIHLYLDNYPDDTNMINEFNKNRELYNNILSEYQSKYGPVVITSDTLSNYPFMWDNEPWPWEGSAN